MLDMMQAPCESRLVHHTHKSKKQWRNGAQTRSTQQMPGGPLTDRCMYSTSTHLSTTSREGRAGVSGGGRIEPLHLGTCSSSRLPPVFVQHRGEEANSKWHFCALERRCEKGRLFTGSFQMKVSKGFPLLGCQLRVS